jgi:hypothetical protein
VAVQSLARKLSGAAAAANEAAALCAYTCVLDGDAYMLDGLPAWTAHSEHQEVWAGLSCSSIALRYDVAFM